MKEQRRLAVITIAFAMVSLAGCASLFTKQAAPTSLPITMGAATNGTPEATAWLQLAQQLNRQGNPTQTEAPIAVILGAAITISGALTGYFGHRTASANKANTG